MAMYKVTYTVMWGLLCLFLLGCEMVQEVDLPPHTPRLTMRFVLSDGGETPVGYYGENRVFIGRSQGTLDNQELSGVANATVKLLDAAGQLVETYEHIGTDQGEYLQLWGVYEPTQDFVPVSGQTYTMHVEAPGFEAIEATTAMPASTTFSDVAFTRRHMDDNGHYNYTEGNLQLTIQDEPGVKSYYKVVVYALDSTYRNTGYMAYTIDAGDDIGIGEPEKDELNRIISDELYASGSIKFSSNLMLPSYAYSQNGDLIPVKHLEVQVQQLNKDEYLFQKTMEAQGRTEGNPFAEYSNVYSNVKHGYGALGAMSVTKMVVDL